MTLEGCVCVCVSQGRLLALTAGKKVGRKTFLLSSHVLNIHHLMSVVMVTKENNYQNKAHKHMDKADGIGNH